MKVRVFNVIRWIQVKFTLKGIMRRFVHIRKGGTSYVQCKTQSDDTVKNQNEHNFLNITRVGKKFYDSRTVTRMRWKRTPRLVFFESDLLTVG